MAEKEQVAETIADDKKKKSVEKKADVKAVKKIDSVFDIKSGQTVRVHQKLREANTKGEIKERVQIFEGIVLAVKHGKTAGATMTVRKISEGIGVEKIFPLYSPVIVKIEIMKKADIRRAKLYYLRSHKKKLREKKVA